MYIAIVGIILFFLFFILFNGKPEKKITFMSIEYTSFLRGLAIILIILSHSVGHTGVRIFTPLGGIGVALFLLLSGYGLTESYKKNRLSGFWKKKLLRIWLPYFLFIILLVIIRNDYKYVLTVDFFLDVLCLKTSFWFIGFLVWNYILFWIVFRFNILRKYHIIPFIIFAIYIFVFQKQTMAEQSISFYLGVCLSLYIENVRRFIANKQNIFVWLILCILFIAVFILGIKQIPLIRSHEGENIYFHAINLVVKLGFCLFLLFGFAPFLQDYYLEKKINNLKIEKLIGNRFLILCSKISLELYLIHYALLFLLVGDNVFRFLIFIFCSFVGAYIFNFVNNYLIKVANKIFINE